MIIREEKAIVGIHEELHHYVKREIEIYAECTKNFVNPKNVYLSYLNRY